ncbi:MAG: helix-turn-helix transcriptional regulator [Flavobacteriaceae bacterium]|nr:helix-turn-helix transcriptional regulator [Flavobacteriaceae bacterium]
MINSQDFAKRLQKILDFYSISATAFSDKLNFNRSTISHLLSGRNKPSLEFILKVLHEFPEVELYWLVNGKGSFPATASNIEKAISPLAEENFKTQKELPLFAPSKAELAVNSTKSEIDRIVIFFKDGSFQSYE